MTTFQGLFVVLTLLKPSSTLHYTSVLDPMSYHLPLDALFLRLSCIHVISDGSPNSDDVIAVLYKTAPTTVINGKLLDTTTCRGLILVARTSTVAANTLQGMRFMSSTRTLLFVMGPIDSLLEPRKEFVDFDLIIQNSTNLYHLSPNSPTTFHKLNINGILVLKELNKFPNFRGRLLRISTYHCPPFSYQEKNTSVQELEHQGIPNGVEMDIFLQLAKTLNFTWYIVNVGRNKWGQVWENGSWTGGMVGALVSGHVDVIFCNLWVMETTYRFIDLSPPWTQTCLTFLVPRPRIKHWIVLLMPFERQVWLALVIAGVLTTVMLWLLSLLRCGIATVQMGQAHRYEKLSTSTMDVLSILLVGTAPSSELLAPPMRHVVNWWFVLSLLVTTAYSSGLVRHLSFPPYEPRLDTPQALAQSGVHWGQPYIPDMKFNFDLENPWHRKLTQRFMLESSSGDRVKRIASGRYAVLGSRLGGGKEYFIGADRLEGSGSLHRLRVMHECLSRHYIALGFVKHSPLTEPFSSVMWSLLEAGVVGHWEAAVVRRFSTGEMQDLFREWDIFPEVQEPSQLQLTHFISVFVCLGLGLLLSFGAFLLELLVLDGVNLPRRIACWKRYLPQ